ncbi:MAG: flippase-like domain-containing protein [Ardenticatenaceae bacterium]|nr:flippase-like domain-containing protein [Anaerolineales bacterium]MCB8966931.1 flippase-like domain-containing protein [Ardenticatenaceae bacterium]MCB8989095.1 flippase-like domain-containing protein [Ardenticatenaceae bacterium]
MLKNKKVQGILQIGLSLALLALLLRLVGLDEVITTLSNLDWGWYLPALLLFIVNIIIRGYRWYLLLHALNERPSLIHLIYLYFIGFFANNFIPSGFGGDVVKIVSLRQSYGRGTEALSSVVMERVTGLMGSAIIALIALSWNGISHTTNIELPLALWLAIVIISFGIPVAFILIRWLEPTQFITNRVPKLSKLPKFDKLGQLEDTVRRYPVPVLLQSLSISIPFTLSLILVQYSIARALNVTVPLAAFGLFVPIIAIVNLLPISFNGLGLREGLYLFLFGSIGVSSESAVAMSLAFYSLRFIAGMLGGLLYALRSVAQLLRSPHAKNL